MTGSRSRIDDALEDGRHRKPADQTPGATALQGRDEVRALLEEHAMPRAGGARVLSPDEVLAELRRLKEQRMDTPAATPAALPTQAAETTPAQATQTQNPAPSQPPSRPAAPPLPALPVGAPLPGMPEYIVVGRTYAPACVTPASNIPTQQIRFVDYLRNVLPNEWVAGWPQASLDAGAIAAKQFAWYTIVFQRKWRSQGYPFDVVDNTCDHYYRDASADPRTDAAIQRTWGTFLTRNGVLFNMYYRDTEATCGGIADCMGQVESAVLASAGQSSLQILARYYNAPGTAVQLSGARLPAQLPPVPPAPAVVLHPGPTVAPIPPTFTPAPIVATATFTPLPPTPTAALETAPGTGTPVAPSPTTERPAGTMAPTSEAPTATPGEGQMMPTEAPTNIPITPMPVPSTPVPDTLPLPPIAPTEAPAVPTPVPTVPALPTAPPTPVVPTEMPTAVLPSLIGLGEDQAKGTLAALGITQVVVDYQGRDRLGDVYDSVPAYAVVSHSPPAGAPAAPGTQVVLGVRAP